MFTELSKSKMWAGEGYMWREKQEYIQGFGGYTRRK
jgi:hypothetical protein